MVYGSLRWYSIYFIIMSFSLKMYIMQYLEEELGVEALRTMKKIKSVLDPNNIMNPGKLIPPHICF